MALLVHRDASKRQSISVSARAQSLQPAILITFLRQKTFASLKLQDGPGDMGDAANSAPPDFPRHNKEAKLEGRRGLAKASKGGRGTTCEHKWVPHFNGGVCYTIVVQVTCSSV